MNLPDQCRLHLGLYILASKGLKVDYDLEYLINQIFGGEDPGIYEMLQLMDRQGLIKIDEDVVYLPAWPRGKSRPVAGKIENLSITRLGDSYHPLSEPTAQKQEKNLSRNKNLAGVALDRDIRIFLEKWPGIKNEPYKKNLGKLRDYWSWLVKSGIMPPLNVLLFVLGNHPPKKGVLPATWMKKRFWLNYWQPVRMINKSRACPFCLDEGRRLVFDPETGQKKLIICSCTEAKKNGKKKRKDSKTAKHKLSK